MIRSMLPSINLRYDLASTSDAQLADRLELASQMQSRAEADALPLSYGPRFAVQSDILGLTRSSHG